MAGDRDELAEDGGSVWAVVWEEWQARSGPFARFALDPRTSEQAVIRVPPDEVQKVTPENIAAYKRRAAQEDS